MKNQPLVSVITPCYNSTNFIEDTILSVLNQTYQNWELLITDDGSTDNSTDVINEFIKKDKRIKLFKIKNGGAAVARNHSIHYSEGSYIAFLDSDDLWLPTKLEKQITFMEVNKYPITYTSYKKMTESGVVNGDKVSIRKMITYRDMLKSNKIGCLTAIYNKDILGKVYMPLIKKRQDYALWLKILKMTPEAYGLDEVLANYRIRKSSLSAKKTEMIKWNWLLFRDIEKKDYISSVYFVFHNILYKLLNK